KWSAFMSDLETGISLKSATRRPELMIDNKPANLSTLIRWTRDGVKVGDQRIRLRTWKVGRGRVTSLQAIREFLTALSPATPLRTSPAANDRRPSQLE